MSDATTSSLVESLQRSRRRWKILALSLFSVLGLVIIIGGTSAAVATARARQQEMAAMEALMQARQEAEQTRIRGGNK